MSSSMAALLRRHLAQLWGASSLCLAAAKKVRCSPFGSRLWLGLLILGVCAQAAVADGPWSGEWDTRWRGGGAHMSLKQSGSEVTGTYPLYDGRIEATANGLALDGIWIQGARRGTFHFRLAQDGSSFTGRFDTGEWWTGGRGPARPLVAAPDQSGPRETLRTFLTGGNLAHSGLVDQFALAVAVLDFGPDSTTMTAGQKAVTAQPLFDLMNLTTIQLWSVPGKEAPGDMAGVQMRQAGNDAALSVTFRKRDGKWWLEMPGQEALVAARRALLARYGGRAPAPDSHLAKGSARDAVIAFNNAFLHWDRGGAAQALDTLDTAHLAQATRKYEGLLAAQYLKRVLDRVDLMAPQEIPDDPNERQPFVRFRHPAGSIVVAPMQENGATVWRFTEDTVRSAAVLFAAVDTVPPDPASPPPPFSQFFTVRQAVADTVPALLMPVGAVEAWQIVVPFLFAVMCLAVAAILARLVVMLIRRRHPDELRKTRYLAWPLWIVLAAILFKLAIPFSGWPEQVRVVSAPVHALIISIFGVWAGWLLIDTIGRKIMELVEISPGRVDAIMLWLVLGSLRILLVVVAAIYAATQFSVPINGIIAGLGFSGLAFTLASKDTVSNLFGAGILAIDRPFKRGDWIVTDAVRGTVEHVGIRSTRVRTAEDTVAVVPNGKLADTAISNWGTRRHRLSGAKLMIGYSCSPKQLNDFIAKLEQILHSVPEVVDHRTEIGVTDLTDRGVELDIKFYLNTSTAADERRVKNAVFLQILALVDLLRLPLGVNLSMVGDAGTTDRPDRSKAPEPALAPAGTVRDFRR
jgi:MscS family membrane protein